MLEPRHLQSQIKTANKSAYVKEASPFLTAVGATTQSSAASSAENGSSCFNTDTANEFILMRTSHFCVLKRKSQRHKCGVGGRSVSSTATREVSSGLERTYWIYDEITHLSHQLARQWRDVTRRGGASESTSSFSLSIFYSPWFIFTFVIYALFTPIKKFGTA